MNDVIDIDFSITKPHPGQKKVLDERKRFNVLNCGRRWGKSNLAINLLTVPALNGNPVAYFAPTYKLLEGTFNECLAALNANVTYSDRLTYFDLITRKHDQQFIETIHGGKIEFWSLENELAGRSRKYYRVIVDEAAFVKNLWQSWTESIRPTLTDLKGDVWFMSTPKGKNDFFKLYDRGKRGEPNWMSWQMSTYTNPYIDKSEIDDARADLPELAFSQEYLAEFNDNVANPFGLSYIKQCTFLLSNLPAVCFGVDLAKSFDWTVIIGLDKNGSVCHFDRFQMDWRATTQKVIDLPKGVIAIDSTGVGDPIGESVARARGDVDLIKFTQTSKQQLMEGLALAIQKRSITFPEGVITDELSNFEYEYTRSGVKYSAPSGLHDDAVCALALAVSKFSVAQRQGAYLIL